jgi:hypothetical protein
VIHAGFAFDFSPGSSRVVAEVFCPFEEQIIFVRSILLLSCDRIEKGKVPDWPRSLSQRRNQHAGPFACIDLLSDARLFPAHQTPAAATPL